MAADNDQQRDGAGVVDDLDRQILRRLQQDGRMPYRQIARELGVSEGTIRGRANRMEELGVLSIVSATASSRSS